MDTMLGFWIVRKVGILREERMFFDFFYFF